MTSSANRKKHLLLYEPRTEGHHLGWLRFIADDLLSANFQLSIAADLRAGARERVEQNLAGLLGEVKLISAYDANGRRHLDGKARSVAHCLKASGAENVFLGALDEIASDCWRNATFGLRPPPELRGRIGGIYHRPRFLGAPQWSLDRALKISGFNRLLREGWWQQILFVDEFLAAELQKQNPTAPIFFLADACPSGYDGDAFAARKTLEIPADKKVFLFYGTGARRKGLHVAVEAMLQLPPESPAFLLCAGQQNPTGKTADDIAKLIRQNRARLLDRYVTVEEEKMCFVASDAVLLPYLNHFGTSGVLSRAMSAGKPVIVSDEQLVGRLTREHQLGLAFPSGNVSALAQSLRQMTQLSAAETNQFAAAAQRYAQTYSRTAFRTALLRSLGVN
ncbi:MAG TPA: glycosyltransferase family 4 protein [Verrucomicrobiae bacterium]